MFVSESIFHFVDTTIALVNQFHWIDWDFRWAVEGCLDLRKGFHTGIDSYSAFRENDRMTRTGLDGYLKARGFTRLIICGLALDYCVAWTAIDGRQAGFDIAVVVEATAAIDLDGSRRRMLSEMRQGGINLNATA